jgi:hypothetical protein
VIRVERGEEVRHGVFAWRVPSLGLSGSSRQPLLDACRSIKSILGRCGDEQAAIYRAGMANWDKRCSVEWGASHVVKEPSVGKVHFAKFTEVDWATFREAAE